MKNSNKLVEKKLQKVKRVGKKNYKKMRKSNKKEQFCERK